MPLQVPVFERELMNKMYTPTPYLFGRMISHILLYIFSPIIASLILYFGLGASNKEFPSFLLTTILVNLIGCIVGYWCGVSFKVAEGARQMGTLLIILFHLLSGGLSNPAAVNPFIDALQYISPNRYSVQLFFTILITDNPNFCDVGCLFTEQDALNAAGFSTPSSNSACYGALGGFIILF